ncbi:MAG: DUF2854 domain-containing protein [Pseudanabaenaceae cyanobacterium]
MFRKVSLGTVGLYVGAGLLVLAIYGYATGNSTLNLATFFYGIPILLGGAALKAAEVTPVPILPSTEPAIAELRQTATPTQTQIREDVTRYRYGIKAHLDIALEKVGLSPADEVRPQLQALYEEASETGTYVLGLRFHSPHLPLEVWDQRREKIERFFGPGAIARLVQPAPDTIDLQLIALPKPTQG